MRRVGGESNRLSEAALAKVKAKVEEALALGFAEVTLVIEHGRLRWIRGPAPSEPVQE